MEQRDQETRAAALANENSTNVAAAEQVDAANLKRLKAHCHSGRISDALDGWRRGN